MADVFSAGRRSAIMSRIKSRGNRATELRLMRILREAGITGWRRHQPVFGKPDFIFRKERVAVFVDGCFWHGCPKHATFPATRRAFWSAKLARNKARDRLVTRTLRQRGWRVLRLWQHELARTKLQRCLVRIRRALGP